eukprot:30949-Pelagococcus_subviridis.AAC.7
MIDFRGREDASRATGADGREAAAHEDASTPHHDVTPTPEATARPSRASPAAPPAPAAAAA